MDEKELEKLLDIPELLEFSKKFRKKKEEEEKNLPYHVNVIDELHINENGHSRVLTKILQYKNEKKEYLILQSLLNYIVNSKKMATFDHISIKDPTITQEIARIDLWVRDENYAIIFENKIYNAADQDAQICRYIEKTKEKKYKEEQIFVIYLSRDGKEPDEQSWGSYKESFKSRYVNLSFRYDILPWLKNDVIPNVRQKDVYLLSALQQYVFFLEGDKMFRTDEIYKNMNTKLNEMIEEYYSLTNGKVEDQIAKLLNVSDVLKQVEEKLIPKYYKKLHNIWEENTKSTFSKKDKVEIIKSDSWVITGVKIHDFKGKEIRITIGGGLNRDEKKWIYCGIDPIDESEITTLKESLEKELKEENPLELDVKDHSIFRTFPVEEYDKIFPFFEKLVKWSIKKDDSDFTAQP